MQKQKGIRINIGHSSRHGLDYEMKSIFIGHRTVFSLLGFIVGGILVGRSIWHYLYESLPLYWVIIIGVVVFVVSGLILHEFGDRDTDDEIET